MKNNAARKTYIPGCLTVWLIAGGVLGIVLNCPNFPLFTVWNVFSIALGIVVFFRFRWGRLAVIYYSICIIIFNCLYFSPILYKMRVRDCELNCKTRRFRASKYRTIDEKVYRDELANEKEWLEQIKKKKFDFFYMFSKSLIPALIIFFLCRPKVKKQFEWVPAQKDSAEDTPVNPNQH